jgi:hypothetical protein
MPGDIIELGGEAGNAIDPWVNDAHDGFNNLGRKRWLDAEDAELLG